MVAHGILKMRLNPTCSDKSVTSGDQHQNRERKGNMRVGKKFEGKKKKKRKLFAFIINIEYFRFIFLIEESK